MDHEACEVQKTIQYFDHTDMIGRLYGSRYKFLPSIAVIIYLFGVAISKCILTGKTLSTLFENVEFLDNFYLWLVVFFIAGALFSFKSIEKTKIMQIVIIAARILTVTLMLVGAFIIIGQNGKIQDLRPKDGNLFFNIEYFDDIFSNLIFSFMFHHSLPGITKELTKISQIRQFLFISFIAAGSTVLSIAVTAVLAFGNDLVTNVDMFGAHRLTYYNYDFKGRLDFIYYIASFYIFLNLSSFAVLIIVIRRNMLTIWKPTVNSDRPSKITVFLTGVILLIVLALSLTLR